MEEENCEPGFWIVKKKKQSIVNKKSPNLVEYNQLFPFTTNCFAKEKGIEKQSPKLKHNLDCSLKEKRETNNHNHSHWPMYPNNNGKTETKETKMSWTPS